MLNQQNGWINIGVKTKKYFLTGYFAYSNIEKYQLWACGEIGRRTRFRI